MDKNEEKLSFELIVKKRKKQPISTDHQSVLENLKIIENLGSKLNRVSLVAD